MSSYPRNPSNVSGMYSEPCYLHHYQPRILRWKHEYLAVLQYLEMKLPGYLSILAYETLTVIPYCFHS